MDHTWSETIFVTTACERLVSPSTPIRSHAPTPPPPPPPPPIPGPNPDHMRVTILQSGGFGTWFLMLGEFGTWSLMLGEFGTWSLMFGGFGTWSLMHAGFETCSLMPGGFGTWSLILVITAGWECHKRRKLIKKNNQCFYTVYNKQHLPCIIKLQFLKSD